MMRARILTAVIFITGCSLPATGSELSMSAIMTGRRAPKHRGEVVVVMEGDPAPPVIEEIAVLQAIGLNEKAHPTTILQKIKASAAHLGCDTLVRTRMDYSYPTNVVTAVCVRTQPSTDESSKSQGETAAAHPSEVRPAGEDEVVLKSGETIRGTLLVMEPGRRVIILDLTANKPVHLLWYKVGSVERGKYPPPAAPAEPPKPVAPPPCDLAPPAAATGVPRLHIVSSDPEVQLQRWLKTSVPRLRDTVVLTSGNEFICKPPCDKLVDARMGQEYLFTGPGISPSERFLLMDRQGDTTIEVSPGDVTAKWMSIGLIIGGATMSVAANPLMFVALTSDVPDSFKVIAFSVGVSGAAILGGGIAARVLGTTTYRFTTRPARERTLLRSQEEL